MIPVWAVTGQPATAVLIELLCDGDLTTREFLSGQVVLR